MVAIAPFKAIRYNPSKVSNLSQVICPPYDVISVPDYHKLLGRHKANLVRVELPLAQGKEDRYAVSSQVWEKWLKQRILVEDKEPAFFGYEQRFSVNNQPYFRRGFFAALKIEEPGKGKVRPHERTFPKHKEDRLKLMRATHANISPIFGIFFDHAKKAQELLNEKMDDKPTVVSRDDKGVTHRVWRWTDKAALKTLTGVLSKEEVLIADGHHRYETGWTYAVEAGKKSRAKNPKQAFRYILIFLCPLSDPGLVIQPTHRTVRMSLPLDEWKKRIEPIYTMQPISSLKPLFAKLRAPNEHNGLAMILEGGKLFWLEPKSGQPTLPVVQLHERILKDVPLENIGYGQNIPQIIETVQRGEANAAFLLPPPEKELFAKICRSGKLMPQKSTYFYPKVATGFVMRSLDGLI